MENSNIKEIVAGFKNLIDRVNGECSDEVINTLFIASQTMLKDLLPYKYFALDKTAWKTDILIFDNNEDRDKWLLSKDSMSVSSIEFSQMDTFSNGEWDNLNNYKITSNGELVFDLW